MPIIGTSDLGTASTSSRSETSNATNNISGTDVGSQLVVFTGRAGGVQDSGGEQANASEGTGGGVDNVEEDMRGGGGGKNMEGNTREGGEDNIEGDVRESRVTRPMAIIMPRRSLRVRGVEYVPVRREGRLSHSGRKRRRNDQSSEVENEDNSEDEVEV